MLPSSAVRHLSYPRTSRTWSPTMSTVLSPSMAERWYYDGPEAGFDDSRFAAVYGGRPDDSSQVDPT